MLGGLYQQDEVKSYVSTSVASVMHVVENYTGPIEFDYRSKKGSSTGVPVNTSMFASVVNLENIENTKRTVISKKKNVESIEFEIEAGPYNSFATPGSKDERYMTLVLGTKESAAKFSSLKLKISGVDTEVVEAGRLIYEGEVLAEGVVGDGYISFKHLGVEIPEESEASVIVSVDLSSEVTTGNRLRLDIENPDDLAIRVAGEDFEMSGNYPIKGVYLSIVRPRPWSKSPWQRYEEANEESE